MKWMAIALVLFVSKPAAAIEVLFNHGTFMAPGNSPYLETYMYFYGSDVRYAAVESSGFQATVELTYIFEQRGKIYNFSKTLVKSPVTQDTAGAISDFIDQQRFFLDRGEYDLVIKLRDVNNPLDTGVSMQRITVDFPEEGAFFSDIMAVDYYKPSEKQTVYTRHGKEVYPRVSSFYAPEATELSYYCELYHTEAALGVGAPYLVNVDLVHAETDQVMAQYRFTKRYVSSEIEVLMGKLDIGSLRSGSYLLRLEARNRNNEVVAAKSMLVQRLNNDPPADSLSSEDLAQTFVNAIQPLDSLRDMTFCLRHRSDFAEQNFIDEKVENGTETELRRFFYGYWYDRNPIDPKGEWLRYHDLVEDVEKNYSGSQTHGCATDRGRIYLKYGKPSSITNIPNEPQSYPYEIWHYNKVHEKSNAKFVFYDPTRVRENYIILHSNVQGEQQDIQWLYRLKQPLGTPNTTDEVQDFQPDYGSRAMDYWNNPR